MLKMDNDAVNRASIHEKCDAIEALWITDGHVMVMLKLLRGVTRSKDSLVVVESIYWHEL